MTPTPDDEAAPGLGVAPAPRDTPEARDELVCPLCGYSLRGLNHSDAPDEVAKAAAELGHVSVEWSRCPECGYVCYWRQLLRAHQFRHPYLFEHQPRRNFVSYFRTFLAGLRPRRFWSTLHAGHELRPRRLFLYWVVTSAAIILSCVEGRWLIDLVHMVYQNRLSGKPLFTGPLPRVLEFFDSSDLEFAISLLGIAWPIVSLLALLIFQASMGRARLRKAHVLRCVVYSGDVFVGVGVAAVLLQGLYWLHYGLSATPSHFARLRLAAAGAAILIVAATYRLATAYRCYLRFDRPVATVIACQAVVVLLFLAAFAIGSRQFYWLFL